MIGFGTGSQKRPSGKIEKVYTFSWPVKNNPKNSNKMEQIKVTMKQKGLTMEADKNEFALALKTWRLRKGLTQKQVGERWGCSRFTIMRAETAKNVTWEMAYRLFAKLSDELRKEADNG